MLLLSLLCTAADEVRRRFMVTRPVRLILRAAEKITRGDFSVRIPPLGVLGEDGFDEIAAAFNTLAQELSGMETLRSDFIANVSHELKTPLAVLQNYGALLLGVGMCCTMVWVQWFAAGIAVGLAGIALIAAALPLYNRITRRERQKLAPEILRLTADLEAPPDGRRA